MTNWIFSMRWQSNWMINSTKSGLRKTQKKFTTDQDQENFSRQKNPIIIILIRATTPWNLMQPRNSLKKGYPENSLKKKNR